MFSKKRGLFRGLSLIFLICILPGCTSTDEFHIKDLAKTNIDVVSDVHLKEATALLKALTRKLYKRNPNQLHKVNGYGVEYRISQIFNCPADAEGPDELKKKNGTEAVLLGFDPEFEGDRVFAMMYGLYTMIHQSYNSKCELFMLDYLDQQNLYNSARNIEIFVWRLKNRHKPDGSTFLLTNSLDRLQPNLSYERLFGKLISVQDTMAKIIATRTGRTINQVVRAAGMTFLPIGI